MAQQCWEFGCPRNAVRADIFCPQHGGQTPPEELIRRQALISALLEERG